MNVIPRKAFKLELKFGGHEGPALFCKKMASIPSFILTMNNISSNVAYEANGK